MGIHFNIHPDVTDTFPASQSNEISKEYYDFLVGEINRRTIRKNDLTSINKNNLDISKIVCNFAV